jgi:4-alpha-glucanotransferase
MTDAWSVTDGYWDTEGHWHPTSDDVRAALHAAMDVDDAEAPPVPPPMWFVAPGSTSALARPCHIVLEDSTTLGPVAQLSPDLPCGYHGLVPDDGGPATTLVVTPRRCRTPSRCWGWATQLYALRSASSWGIGDLADLRRLSEWSASLGAGVVLINPLHATAPGQPQEPSPYFPTSRRWRNICYLRISEVVGAASAGPDFAGLDEAARALNGSARIDRDAVHRAKLDALGPLYERFDSDGEGHERFTAWVEHAGDSLERFAVWSVLAERYGPAFTAWPAQFRHPGSASVADVAARERHRVRFHQWCQWQLDDQLARASDAGPALIADLAVGFDPSGFDAWADQDVLALGCRIGAPPDTFNPLGQDWGLPPYVPWKLRATLYRPFIETVRATLNHVGGVRIDHVMGLFRLYWIPPGAPPEHGAYVRYPASDLLDLIAVEAHRAGAFVVGEDLGTVEEEVRAELTDRGVLSTRLVWFEEQPPRDYPVQAMAGITTHDLPTVAGVWSGQDLTHRQRMGLNANGADDDYFRAQLVAATGVSEDASVDDVIVAAHRALAEAPSLVLTATLDDATAAVDRPNVPGTVDGWPNWQIPLPELLDDLMTDARATAIAQTLDAGVRHGDDGVYGPSQ